MQNSLKKTWLYVALLFWSSCNWVNQPVELKNEQIINSNTLVESKTYLLEASSDFNQPVLVIEGDDITVDFNGAILQGSTSEAPNQYQGLAVLVKNSRQVTIKNLSARGYKIALMAEDVDSLQLINCDFSYNYRPRLLSTRERENLADWLSFHQNEKDEWLRYGAGVYLKNCKAPLVKDVTITGGQNGLLMHQCDSGLIYNNSFHFNSGLGIGMYRSNGNRVMHNRLDWNVRGYSHGFYSRGQDSAGILCYEQSSDNVFAYNSATHSGDGFFLWAGQTTMDTGEGGANDNLVYRNDFSYAPTNGVEVTFSRNKIIENVITNCRYGIWGGYSWESEIIGNVLKENEYGIAIEHGQENKIVANQFKSDSIGVYIWERPSQPKDWGYAQKNEIDSRDYNIQSNLFDGVQVPLKIERSKYVNVNEANCFQGFKTLLESNILPESFNFSNNQISQTIGWGAAASFVGANIPNPNSAACMPKASFASSTLVAPLPDGMNTELTADQPVGKSNILMTEWGPYDFKSPSIWLEKIEGDEYVFSLLGPQGNWKLKGGKGFKNLKAQAGVFPATLRAKRDPKAEELVLNLEFIGEAMTTPRGKKVRQGAVYPFSFYRYEKDLEWDISWYAYEEQNDPITNTEHFVKLKNKAPLASVKQTNLAFDWWRSPAEGVPADKFATFAQAKFESKPGVYKLRITSDDGVRLYLDGKLLIDHWDIHVPAMDEVEVTLGKEHLIEIEHFDAGGLATLIFEMEKVHSDTL